MKVLVTAASRHGSTAEIATIIAGVLRASDIDAERHRAGGRLSARPTTTPSSSARPSTPATGCEPAKAFVARRTPSRARDRPVFLFSSGPIGDPPQAVRWTRPTRSPWTTTGAVDHQVFPGRLIGADLSLPERLVTTRSRMPYGDFRPWDDISTGRGRSPAS